MACGILPFITTIGKEETECGITEEMFDLKIWKQALSSFDKIEADISLYRLGKPISLVKKDSQWTDMPFIIKSALFLLGGGISALCSTAKSGQPKTYSSILDLVACPTCQSRPPLVTTAHRSFTCPGCGAQYFSKNDIIFLLPKQLEKELYGHI